MKLWQKSWQIFDTLGKYASITFQCSRFFIIDFYDIAYNRPIDGSSLLVSYQVLEIAASYLVSQQSTFGIVQVNKDQFIHGLGKQWIMNQKWRENYRERFNRSHWLVMSTHGNNNAIY